jgi:glyoxylase-like metal-dependent hydrolase (beta-lactamase superfamily II)
VSERWREVADRVFVRRHRSFDLNVGLVVGEGACLVVDTRMSHRQGRELVAAVRTVTRHPWTVLNTHAHFDHFFGNAVFRPAEIWGHARCAEVVARTGDTQRTVLIEEARRLQQDDVVAELSEVDIDPPDRTFTTSATLDIGGRTVHLRHLGRGHTDNDAVLEVADAGVIFAGDLVEEGAPPSFEDSYPLEWPSTVDRMLTLARGPVVPGHGAVVDRDHVTRQAGELRQVAELARAGYAAGRDVEELWRHAPYPERYARTALTRAYLQLSPPVR